MIKVDYVFHITPEAEKVIQKVAETLAQAITTDARTQTEQTKTASIDETDKDSAKDSAKEAASADTAADQGKLNIEFNFGEEFESITKILDEKLKTFSAPGYKPTRSKTTMPEPDIIKQITSSLTGYHDLFNEITCIQQPQDNLLIVDRFTKGNPIHHKRYMLNVDKNKDSSYTLRVALDDFTLSFQFTSENIVNTVRHLVKVVISSDVIG